MRSYCSFINKCVSNKSFINIDKNTKRENYPSLFCELLRQVYSLETLNIIQQIIHIELYSYVINMYQFLLEKEFDYKSFVKYKFTFLTSVLENMFYNEETKDLYFSYFSKIQKIHLAFMRFSRLYKYKKAVVQISSDLYMNELDEKSANVFVLFQNNCKYLFSASDLVNIMNNNLSNSYLFFSEPLVPKNPYNNIVFDHATLYNIYFFMKSRPFAMPVLYQQFFNVDFDLEIFREDNEQIIREESIKRYVYSTSPNILYNTVVSMIETLKSNNPKYKILCIHKNFPKNKLVEIMRPYLHLYYLSKYYVVGTEKITNSYEILIKKFDLFIRYNPYFGRKLFKLDKNNKLLVDNYDENHMNFYKKYDKSVFKKLPNIDHDEMFGYNGEFDTDDSIRSTIRNNTSTSLHNAVEYIRFHGVASGNNEEDEHDEDEQDEDDDEIIENASEFIMDNDTDGTNSDDEL
uniref:Uncharacterized protein n=1 Tax=viral metagenome TaxID=1070528 RepID=A0A6C0DDR8_9ZZZZ